MPELEAGGVGISLEWLLVSSKSASLQFCRRLDAPAGSDAGEAESDAAGGVSVRKRNSEFGVEGQDVPRSRESAMDEPEV